MASVQENESLEETTPEIERRDALRTIGKYSGVAGGAMFGLLTAGTAFGQDDEENSGSGGNDE